MTIRGLLVLLFEVGTLFVTVEAIRILPSSRTRPPPATATGDHEDHRHRRIKQHAAEQPNVDVDVPTSPDEHLVTSLPLLDASSFTTQHWAGHLPSSADGDKYFFYWLFAPDIDDECR